MTQVKLNDLATLTLEREMLKKIDYENTIEIFISRNTKNDDFNKCYATSKCIGIILNIFNCYVII